MLNEYQIPTQALVNVLNYLAERPYKEVFQLIASLQGPMQAAQAALPEVPNE